MEATPSPIDSVVLSKKVDGSWTALHVPSGKVANGLTPEEASDEMKKVLGMNDAGEFEEPLTSPRFAGLALEVAEFLEGPISDMLASHSGFARLEAFENGIAHVRLGGGCQGCPSATFTLVRGVREQLQERFGEDQVADIAPVH